MSMIESGPAPHRAGYRKAVPGGLTASMPRMTLTAATVYIKARIFTGET